MALVLWFLLIPLLAFSHLIPLFTPVVAGLIGAPPAPSITINDPPYTDSKPSPFQSDPPSWDNPPSSSASGPPSPDCLRKCGDVEIPYPFGTDGNKNCSWHRNFSLTCRTDFNPPRLYADNVLVQNISLEVGEMVVYAPYAYFCYEPSSNGTKSMSGINFKQSPPITTGRFKRTYTTYDLSGSPFLFSAARNEFTAIGCNTLALLEGRADLSYYTTGCIAYCAGEDESAHDDDGCAGLGCCQTSISSNLNRLQVNWNNGNVRDRSASIAGSQCSYAFIAEKGWYNLRRKDLFIPGHSFTSRYGDSPGGNVESNLIPLVLDWAIRDDGSCQIPVEKGATTPEAATASACVSAHSHCVNATQGVGYLCNCSKGYTGNPYVADGCKDINECELRKMDPERYEKQYPCGSGSTCLDRQGDYVCKCKFGYRGNGKSEKGCEPIIPGYAFAIVAMLVASVLACFMIMEIKKQKQRRFFDKNGGEIIKRMDINIFTERQIKKITKGYSTPIGEGAFGKVFLGTIGADEQRVAVKCATIKAEVLPKDEFVNEITFQFRISHENLVRLIGCCLETCVPMLVYEYVPRGSLYNMLHGANKPSELLLPARLNIAIGSAKALAYMHSHGGNHVHGDVKSGNILLDDNLMPKVSDFGSSKLVSTASMYSKWCVSGDMNYIDPVYIKCGCFTEKSDVYSFGVVLLELITGKRAKYGDNSLPLAFVKCCKEKGDGRMLYDKDILSGGAQYSMCYLECLDKIGDLAVRCLKEDVDERPTMEEVVKSLKQANLTSCGGSCSVAS